MGKKLYEHIFTDLVRRVSTGQMPVISATRVALSPISCRRCPDLPVSLPLILGYIAPPGARYRVKS
jgi:hypothetical protein